MSLPLKIKGKRVAKARNIELLEVPLKPYFFDLGQPDLYARLSIHDFYFHFGVGGRNHPHFLDQIEECAPNGQGFALQERSK